MNVCLVKWIDMFLLGRDKQQFWMKGGSYNDSLHIVTDSFVQQINASLPFMLPTFISFKALLIYL